MFCLLLKNLLPHLLDKYFWSPAGPWEHSGEGTGSPGTSFPAVTESRSGMRHLGPTPPTQGPMGKDGSRPPSSEKTWLCLGVFSVQLAADRLETAALAACGQDLISAWFRSMTRCVWSAGLLSSRGAHGSMEPRFPPSSALLAGPDHLSGTKVPPQAFPKLQSSP